MSSIALIKQTMEVIAEAASHFDASVSGAVKYSFETATGRSTADFWKYEFIRNAYCLTEKGTKSRYSSLGEDPEFSPEWLIHLSEEDHRKIADFVEKHRESFWAIDGMFNALKHQCLSTVPRFSYLLRNFILLWDDTTSHTLSESTEDCYSLHAISGLGGVDISILTAEEQERYRALAGFSVDAYLNRFYGRGHAPYPEGNPFAVDEIVYPGYYEVQEPYRSMVLAHPEQAESMIEYLHRGYQADELWELLAQSTPVAMSIGVL